MYFACQQRLIFEKECLIIKCQLWDGDIIEVPRDKGAKFNLIWKVDLTETLWTYKWNRMANEDVIFLIK